MAEVFLGFAFFGVAYFAAYSDLFRNLDAASVTLFALLNGDVIHDVSSNGFCFPFPNLNFRSHFLICRLSKFVI